MFILLSTRTSVFIIATNLISWIFELSLREQSTTLLYKNTVVDHSKKVGVLDCSKSKVTLASDGSGGNYLTDKQKAAADQKWSKKATEKAAKKETGTEEGERISAVGTTYIWGIEHRISWHARRCNSQSIESWNSRQTLFWSSRYWWTKLTT